MNKNNEIQITYETGGLELIDQLEVLWHAQCDYHEEKSIHFSEKFKNLTFEYRKKTMQSESNQVQIIISRDENTETAIGYVISTIDQEYVGELFSLFVQPQYRGLKIGDTLMNQSISWMDANRAKKIQLGVAVGNEEVMKFYNQFGFYPYVVMMERKTN